ncbi:MAG TPA: aminoglycoside phosphotransferase family protein [Xanthobacteraceae bacterium]|nr:aminoglycoside phosphotransferase family protein [Xanthobacteraceae bacterium]
MLLWFFRTAGAAFLAALSHESKPAPAGWEGPGCESLGWGLFGEGSAIRHGEPYLRRDQQRPYPTRRGLPLGRWFEELKPAASAQGGILALSAATARDLLATKQELAVLPGDVPHGNILNFGEHGWLAIDPKGLIGERCFDYANLFCNPDHETARAPSRLARQIEVVADAAGLERKRLLRWVLAWAGLSAVWHIGNGAPPDTALVVAEIAAAQLYL